MESLVVIVIKSLVFILIALGAFGAVSLLERRLLSWFQYRFGPNRVGPLGLLQPAADAVKMIMKEDIIPADADKTIFWLAPVISVACALISFAFIPLSSPVEIGGVEIPAVVSNPNAGALAFLAVTSIGVYGMALGGWASQSKYALLGSLRSTAQMISYELSMGLSLVGVFILAESVNLVKIVEAQKDLPFILLQPLGFLIFLIAAFAELNRTPFDLPEAEAELVSGYNTEYSGMRFALFVMAEYSAMVVSSFLIVAIYLGGWNPPPLLDFLNLPPILWTFIKFAPFPFLFIWVRATLPRLRYDRLMTFGWKVLLPLSVLNLMATAIYVALS